MSDALPRPGRSLPFKFGASLFVLVLTLGLFEGLATWMGPQAPSLRGDGGWVLMGEHDTRLWGLPPGATQSHSFTATINELGFRGVVPQTPKPEGLQRLLLVGDSTFFGHGVDDGHTLADAIHGPLLQDGVQAEVVNFGVPGYSTTQTRLQLDEQGWQLDPDVLLVGNLWSDNDFAPYADADLLRTKAAFADSWWGRSNLLRLLAAAADRARGGEGARIVTWMTTDDWPDEGVRRVPLKDYVRNLDGIVREAASRGVATVFIAPCNTHFIDESPVNPAWAPYFDAQAQVAAHHGLPRVESCAAMSESGARAEALFVDYMHFSEEGNAIVGAAVARTLLDSGWPVEALALSTAPPIDASGFVDANPQGEASEETLKRGPQRLLFGAEDEMGGNRGEPGKGVPRGSGGRGAGPGRAPH